MVVQGAGEGPGDIVGVKVACPRSWGRGVSMASARGRSGDGGHIGVELSFFHYYYAHSKVVIGTMDKKFPRCNALKFIHKTAGMCYVSGKVQLPAIETPPEPLNDIP